MKFRISPRRIVIGRTYKAAWEEYEFDGVVIPTSWELAYEGSFNCRVISCKSIRGWSRGCTVYLRKQHFQHEIQN